MATATLHDDYLYPEDLVDLLDGIAEDGADEYDDDAVTLARDVAAGIGRDELDRLASEGYPLISEHVWEDYARELAEDIGAVPAELQWPVRCIDWQQAAEELRVDYTAYDVAGTTYYGWAY